MTPPAPSTPGHELVPDGDLWVELDENGDPVGGWEWDKEVATWVYQELSAPIEMPRTGIGIIGIRLSLWAIGIYVSLNAIGVLAYLLRRNNKGLHR